MTLLNAERKTLKWFKQVFSHPQWNNMMYAIHHTRSYDEGLLFSEHLRYLLNVYKPQLTQPEYDDYDKWIIILQLHMLDMSDRWDDFVIAFESYLKDRPFFKNNLEEGEQSKNIAIRDNGCHFLSSMLSRYEVIKRKIARREQGKPVKHLMHRHKDELTDQELEERIEHLKYVFNL